MSCPIASPSPLVSAVEMPAVASLKLVKMAEAEEEDDDPRDPIALKLMMIPGN